MRSPCWAASFGRERNRIENAHLRDGFDMTDEKVNVVRIGPER
jgi:hypothetical protein